MKQIFLIDNYDSFTYNLSHYFEALGVSVTTKRNDQFEIDEISTYDGIVLSPGPGLPKNAGLMMQVIENYYKNKPILGICLGHQALGEFWGAKLHNLKKVYHGVESTIQLFKNPIFKGLPKNINVGRYHSWAIDEVSHPLIKIAEDENGVNMAIAHKSLPIIGFQFHPESIMTKYGKKILENWLLSLNLT